MSNSVVIPAAEVRPGDVLYMDWSYRDTTIVEIYRPESLVGRAS